MTFPTLTAHSLTTEAILVCEDRKEDKSPTGHPLLRSLFNPAKCNRPTKHKYVLSELDTQDKMNKPEARMYNLIFQCEVCGAQRRWGSEDKSKNEMYV